MENRIPKYRYNGGANNESRKAQQTGDKKLDILGIIEAAMDKRAADIAQTVTDMFKFMSLTSAMLPNMEIDTGIFRLKVDDNVLFFKITYPESHRQKKCSECKNCGAYAKHYDDDEEGLIYDGD